MPLGFASPQDTGRKKPIKVDTASLVTLLGIFAATLLGLLNRWSESRRKDVERLQAISQILYDGKAHGLWAQKAAVEELRNLKSQRGQALSLAKEVLAFGEKKGGVPDDLLSELRITIAKLAP